MSGDGSIFGRLLADWDHVEHTAEAAAGDVSDWFRRDHPYPDATQAPAAMPVNVGTATTLEEPMSLLDTIKTHVEADVAELEGKLKGVDEGALAILNRVLANPETASVLKDLDGLASAVGIPAGTISGVAGGLKTVLSLYADEPPAQPQQPVAAAPAAQ